MVRCALWCETRLGLDTLDIGRGGLDRKDSCTLELSGAHLCYVVVLDGGFVSVSAQPMDSGESLEKLMTVGDGPDGWRTICQLLQALEHSEIKSLHPRPLEIGGMDANGWVIGD
jgi:hypothetical protein